MTLLSRPKNTPAPAATLAERLAALQALKDQRRDAERQANDAQAAWRVADTALSEARQRLRNAVVGRDDMGHLASELSAAETTERAAREALATLPNTVALDAEVTALSAETRETARALYGERWGVALRKVQAAAHALSDVLKEAENLRTEAENLSGREGWRGFGFVRPLPSAFPALVEDASNGAGLRAWERENAQWLG